MNFPERRTINADRAELDRMQLEYLQAALNRIDVLIHKEVLRWRKAGQDPEDAFRGLYVGDAEVDRLLDRPFATHWGATIQLAPAERRAFTAAYQKAAAKTEKLKQSLHNLGFVPRLEHLAAVFDLDKFDMDALLICLAPTLDLRYERLYGYLQDDVTRKRPSINLILNLLVPPGPERLLSLAHFSSTSPLILHQLIHQVDQAGSSITSLLSQTIEIDLAVVRWILGRYEPVGVLNQAVDLLHPEMDHEDRVLAGDNLARANLPETGPYILACHGPDLKAQIAAARLVAARETMPLLLADLEKLMAEEQPLSALIQLALRDARMIGAIPCLLNLDACLKNASLREGLLELFLAHPGIVILSAKQPWLPIGRSGGRPIFLVDFPVPGYAQRLSLWQNALQNPATPPGLDLPALAGQFYLTSGQIRDTAAAARDLAAQRGTPLTNEVLFAAARTHSNPRLSSLARKILPRFDWGDIILPKDQLALLQEIIDTVRGRPQVLDEWGIGRKLASSRGVTILFAGSPGTGKTMAAEIIARELGLDLFKIDLSTIVSKYIGETEKNLERIFREASASNAILFFDEADALFGKRSEVRDSHDRYANIEISYLLQRMEAYHGVTILATNLRANLHEAFTRRLQFSVDFPFPETHDRLLIWQTLFPPDLPRDPELDFQTLAERFKLAGGNIRNIIVNAAYLASADGGQVTMAYLLHGTRRELQKMGRLVNETDLSLSESETHR